MRLSHGLVLTVTLAMPLLAGCTVNTAPAPTPVVAQERVVVPSSTVVAQPPLVVQRGY
jgi:hypothetical protein